MKKIIIPEEIVNYEIERAIKKFKAAVEKATTNNFPEDVEITVASHYFVFTAPEVTIRYMLGYVEIKTKNYILINNAADEFVISGQGIQRDAKVLIIEGKAYTVKDLVEFIRKGFKMLLCNAEA